MPLIADSAASCSQGFATPDFRRSATPATEGAGTPAQHWLHFLRQAVAAATGRAAERIAAANRLAERARRTRRDGFSRSCSTDSRDLAYAIGFNVADHRLDASFYDLLASEARLGSFVTIALGQVPQEHWFNLGRLLTSTRGAAALLSWSGSMFEFLMPLLVMPTYDSTSARSDVSLRRPPPDRLRQTARRPLGHLRIRLSSHRRPAQLPIPRLRCSGPRVKARAGGRSGHRAVRIGDGIDGRAA